MFQIPTSGNIPWILAGIGIIVALLSWLIPFFFKQQKLLVGVYFFLVAALLSVSAVLILISIYLINELAKGWFIAISLALTIIAALIGLIIIYSIARAWLTKKIEERNLSRAGPTKATTPQ